MIAPLAGRRIPDMVFGTSYTAYPTRVARALVCVAEATETYFEGANSDTARNVVDAVTELYAAREACGV